MERVMTNVIKLSAFGKNDVRGIYNDDITPELFYYIGRAYVKFVCEKNHLLAKDVWLSVCEDARLHSKELSEALIKGINSLGGNVVYLGLAPTPLGYFSEFINYPKEITFDNKISGALIITASHNPKQYNGLKMTLNKASLDEAQIKEVKELTLNQTNNKSSNYRFGLCRKFDIVSTYIEKISQSFTNIGKNIKIVVDSANATGGLVAPKLYRELGCEVVELYSEPDGNFPNHHPNPSDESTLDDIKKAVVKNNADFGIAFDGDSDRIGVIDSKGNYLTGDKLLLIYALDIVEDLVKRGEKPTVVSEVKCSQVLYDCINNTGACAVMCKTGHGYIKSMMRETNAILGGEMSGHIFFKDRFYGFDDAIYAGCRIIEIVAKHKLKNPDFKLEDLLEPFKHTFCSKENRYKVENELKKPILEMVKEKINENKNLFSDKIKDIITIDGLRIVFDGGFALIRQSNTEPVFTLRFEAKDENTCKHYEKCMVNLLDECKKNMGK